MPAPAPALGVPVGPLGGGGGGGAAAAAAPRQVVLAPGGPAAGEPPWAEKYSVGLGRVGGVPLRVHLSFPLLLAFVVVSALVRGAPGEKGLAVGFNLAVYGPLLFGTVVVHELGHCWAARRLPGGVAKCILLWPLGGLAVLGYSASPLEDMQVALAGPLTHLPMGALWAALVAAAHPEHRLTLRLVGPLRDHFLLDLCVAGLFLNVSLLLFNLFVPAYPLDGGRIFANLLLSSGVEPNRAGRVTAYLALAIAAAIFAAGVFTANIFAVLVGVYVASQSFQLLQFVQTGVLHLHPLFAHSLSRVGAGAGAGAGAGTGAGAGAVAGPPAGGPFGGVGHRLASDPAGLGGSAAV